MPGLTMTEQILAKHSGKTRVAPGENIWVDVDVLMTTSKRDITANLTAKELATLKKLAEEPDDKDVVSWTDYQKATLQWRGK